MTALYSVYSIDELREMLRYAHETGDFHWRITLSPNRRKNTRADLGVNTGGYRVIRLPGSVDALAHRVAWAVTTGYWPNPTVDHINRVRADNRWENLRVATAKQQVSHRALTPADFPAGPATSNKWGYSGVTKYKGRFRAECSRGGVRVRGPDRQTPKEAYEALLAKLTKM